VFVNGQWVVAGVHSWGWNNACSYFGLTSCAGLNGNSSSYVTCPARPRPSRTPTGSPASPAPRWWPCPSRRPCAAAGRPGRGGQPGPPPSLGLSPVSARSSRPTKAARGPLFHGALAAGGASVSVCRKAAMSATSCALSTGGSPGWPPKGGSLLRLAW
jgi:hypothetical protein